MEITRSLDLLQCFPLPMALADRDLNLIECSESWYASFNSDKKPVSGAPLSKFHPNIPDVFTAKLKHCIQTAEPDINPGQKFLLPNGKYSWFKWSINAWKDEDGTVLGAIFILMDASEGKREQELSLKAQQVAQVGGWEVNLPDNSLYWDPVTKQIHGVSQDYEPSLEEGINFYKAGADRDKISYLVSKAISDGEPWDTELRIVTVKGDEIWVRAKGEVEFHHGKAFRLFGTFQDIDTQKKAELKSKVATERLSIATEGSKLGIWEYDLQTEEVIWDGHMYELYGIRKGDFAGVYEAWERAVHPEDKERCHEEVQWALEGKKDFDTEFRVIWPNGQVRYIRAKGIVQKDQHGKPVKMTGTNWDNTNNRLSQLKYDELSNRLRIATKASKLGIWEYNFDSMEVFWDENTFEIYELDPNSPKNLSAYWMSVMHPDDLVKTKEMVSATIKNGTDIELELRLQLRSKKLKHIKVTGHFIRNENGWATKIIGTVLDITELKNTRLELLRSEESFSGAFDNSAIGMALVNPKGKWLRVNDTICENLGYSREELLNLTFQDITHPDDLDTDLNLLHEVIRGKRDSYQIEKRYYHKDGQLVYVILTVTAVYDIKNKLTHFISQIMDITPWRKAENQLKQLVDVTKGQNESLLNFAHIVSHNLRSHATNMTMLTNFLRMEMDVEEKQNIVEMLNKASESLNDTVQHLNEVVQVKTSATEKLTALNLQESIKKVKNNLLAVIHESKAECIMKIPKAIKVEVVPAYLDSILLNLFTNAIKYQDPGRQLKLKVSAKRSNGYIVVDFCDNGLGIDLERHQDKLFGMYKTFHTHKDAKGIGLFITKNQIEAMDGKIEVTSKVGEGSTFTIYLKEA